METLPPAPRSRPRTQRLLSQVVAVALGVAAVWAIRDPDPAPGVAGARSGCIPLAVTASSEKEALLGDLATSFNETGVTPDGTCIEVTVTGKSSGETMTALSRGWDEAVDGPRPDVWSPASSSWVVLLRHRLSAKDEATLLPASDIPSIAFSPLVIAMPRPMAEALGWPKAQIGWADLYGLATDQAGWSAVGHPEWGAFRLGKTNPNFSTSGLHALVGSYYAATGLTSDLTLKDVQTPRTRRFVEGIESSVYHYGDISLTFLKNLQAADDAGGGLSYVSAVAIEEKSVWDYNQGNPSGKPETLGAHAPPHFPLAAIYPAEGTPVSDHPFVVLHAPWVSRQTQQAADTFLRYLQAPEQQRRFQAFGFRSYEGVPGPAVAPANGLLPEQPARTLSPPAPSVLHEIQRSWIDVRKDATVAIMIDTSGSMADPGGNGLTKLELAREAAVSSLGELSPTDEVGLWTFSGTACIERVPLGPVAANRPALETAIRSLTPDGQTPLYDCLRRVVERMRTTLDPERITGVIVLSDGKDSAIDPMCDRDCLVGILGGEVGIRVFPVAYGTDADLDTLQAFATASRAALYDASDPTSIEKVLISVLSNF